MIKQLSLFFIVLGMLLFNLVHSQEKNDTLSSDTPKDSIIVGGNAPDTSYREDQFYIGLSFNAISDLPHKTKQSGFSGGLHLGFIRDFPINKKRNIALGTGLGWSINTYSLNMLISQNKDGESLFQVLDRDKYDFDKNHYTTQLVELPLQFRWRTSDASSYKFWRIYAGFRFGYLYYFKSNFKQAEKKITQTKVDGLNRFRYGATFTFGYNTFNFTVYYSLNSLFDNETTEGKSVGFKTFKIGLTFYIL